MEEWVLALVKGLLYVVFVISALLLIIVVLLQESKGGLGEALGGVGAETFGHRASGIARFTGYVAAVFMGSALLIPITDRAISHMQQSATFGTEKQAPPVPNQETPTGDEPQQNQQDTGQTDGNK